LFFIEQIFGPEITPSPLVFPLRADLSFKKQRFPPSLSPCESQVLKKHLFSSVSYLMVIFLPEKAFVFFLAKSLTM